MNIEKTHAASNKTTVKKLDHANDQFRALEPAKSEIEQKEPVIVSFLILDYARLRIFQPHYIVFNEILRYWQVCGDGYRSWFTT